MKKWILVLLGLLAIVLVGCKTTGKAYTPPSGWVSDDTEDLSSSNCVNAPYAYDENWQTGADQLALGNCSVYETYNWQPGFSSGVILETIGHGTARSYGSFQLNCYDNLSRTYRYIYSYTSAEGQGIFGRETITASIPSNCLRSGTPLQLQTVVVKTSGHPQAPVRQIENKIWYNLTPQTQTGTIWVTAAPNNPANIYYNGVYQAQTPWSGLPLLVGTYVVKVTKTGFIDYTETVNLGAGENKNVYANLQPNSTG